MKCLFLMISCLIALGCGPVESTGAAGGSSSSVSSSGTGGSEAAPTGKSKAIEAFQASRRATQQDPMVLAVIDAQTATADMVSLEPMTESARVQSVIDWTLLTYCTAWAAHAGVTWEPTQGTHAPAQAGFEAAAFESAAHDARAKLAPQTWDQAWSGFEAGFLATQASVVGIPSEWTEERKGMLQGALHCAYIGSVASGATDISSALASIGPVGAKLFEAENSEFDALVTQK